MRVDAHEQRPADTVGLAVWHIACVIASTCHSLNERSNAEPRCPEVPNTTRCAAIAASGLSVWYADTSSPTSISIEAGAG